MRVIAGSLGGRRLRAPTGAAIRPTSDRVREAIFNILGPPPEAAAVLDLFAGAGALGIEALSRGAARAVFVDQARPAIRAIGENLADLDLAARAEVRKAESIRALADLARAGQAFDWVFVDPPYAGDLALRALDALGGSSICHPGAVVIVEHDRRRELSSTYGALVSADQRSYGDTRVTFFRRERS